MKILLIAGFLIIVAAAVYAANTFTETYSFTVQLDSESPVVYEVFPAPGSIASHDTVIYAKISDAGAGIDLESLRMSINGTQVPVTITGTKNDCTITHVPAQAWPYGQTVSVIITGSGLEK